MQTGTSGFPSAVFRSSGSSCSIRTPKGTGYVLRFFRIQTARCRHDTDEHAYAKQLSPVLCGFQQPGPLVSFAALPICIRLTSCWALCFRSLQRPFIKLSCRGRIRQPNMAFCRWPIVVLHPPSYLEDLGLPMQYGIS